MSAEEEQPIPVITTTVAPVAAMATAMAAAAATVPAVAPEEPGAPAPNPVIDNPAPVLSNLWDIDVVRSLSPSSHPFREIMPPPTWRTSEAKTREWFGKSKEDKENICMEWHNLPLYVKMTAYKNVQGERDGRRMYVWKRKQITQPLQNQDPKKKRMVGPEPETLQQKNDVHVVKQLTLAKERIAMLIKMQKSPGCVDRNTSTVFVNRTNIKEAKGTGGNIGRSKGTSTDYSYEIVASDIAALKDTVHVLSAVYHEHAKKDEGKYEKYSIKKENVSLLIDYNECDEQPNHEDGNVVNQVKKSTEARKAKREKRPDGPRTPQQVDAEIEAMGVVNVIHASSAGK